MVLPSGEVMEGKWRGEYRESLERKGEEVDQPTRVRFLWPQTISLQDLKFGKHETSEAVKFL